MCLGHPEPHPQQQSSYSIVHGALWQHQAGQESEVWRVRAQAPHAARPAGPSTSPQLCLPSPQKLLLYLAVSPIRRLTQTPYQDVDRITLETLAALPALDRPYSDYDYALLAEILTLAELEALDASRQGKGARAARSRQLP